tara:strand:+ start:2119 stop:2754 length:636 start_codon:yes stop_codon:yes gene_type:complete
MIGYLDLFYILRNYLIFNSLYFLAKRYFNDRRIGFNFVGLVHASLSILMSFYIISNQYIGNNNLNNQISICRNFSLGYFLYDLIICFNYFNGILRIGYIYHHICSIVMLIQDHQYYPIFTLIFLAELSNLPSYPIVYYIQLNKKENHKYDIELKYYKNIQKILYSIVRIFLLGYICFDHYITKGTSLIFYFSVGMYFIGLYWSFKLIFKDN